MLVLSRQTKESIRIDGNILITILDTREHSIKLGVTFLDTYQGGKHIACNPPLSSKTVLHRSK
ncbi:carbon storage regulator [Pseudomonas putida]|jgi:hypothetical protein|uniref:carbon storage regulator n=1 Tax=Pseudomonas putida TaxID=303 RepID=UPI002364A6DA|nr:carbon storage regulator [Pseudomonas putida]MDD2052441.1 carbon storage regulator [Pseudomonas putida]